MRLLVLASALCAFPLSAMAWTVEPGNNRRAAIISRTVPDTTHFGFACWRQGWTFFIKHTPSEGADCEDVESCEGVVRDVTHSVRGSSGPMIEGPYRMFEATFYGQRPFTLQEVRALFASGSIRVRVDPRVAKIWRVEELTLPLDGLGDVLERERRRLTCPR